MFCEYMNNSDNNIALTEDYDMSSKNSYNYKNMCSNYNTILEKVLFKMQKDNFAQRRS